MPKHSCLKSSEITQPSEMAGLFQVESICFSSLPKKQVKDPFHFSVSNHHQSFFSWRVLPPYPPSSSSPTLPIFCTSSNAQPELKNRSGRNSRSSMTDTQLCKELQLFLTSQGLPLDKAPSTKELSNRGREDLAKIVRRRGYKAIQALLVDSDTKKVAVQEGNELYSIKASDTNQVAVQEGNELHSIKANDMEAIVQVTSSISSCEEHLAKKFGTPDDIGQTLESNFSNMPATLLANAESEPASGAPTNLNGSPIVKQGDRELRRRASEFVRTGLLDQSQDSDEEEEEEEEDDNEHFEDSSDEEEIVSVQNGDGNNEGIAAEKAAKLRAKLLPFLKGRAPDEFVNQVTESMLGTSQTSKSLEEFNQASSHIRRDFTSEANLELQEIKSALITKERELREVSRDLEETKAQLALIQAKATAEVAQAKQLALEKDVRLKSADLALANLKRVEVEYWGEGERVELAGSFNGWKYFIAMESDPTSEISKPDGSRGPMMWGTELWLYPGIYEIKFIIDGIWQIDQRREIVTRNSHHNNVLRVEP